MINGSVLLFFRMDRVTRDILVQAAFLSLIVVAIILLIDPSFDFLLKSEGSQPGVNDGDSLSASSGIRLRSEVIENSEVRHSIRILEMDTHDPGYYITVIKANNHISGIESIAGMKDRYESHTGDIVMGIINGNYWRAYSYNPIGPVVHNGEVVFLSTIRHWTSALFDEHNRLYIDTFKLEGILRTAGNDIFRIYNVNLRLKKEGIIVYNQYSGGSVPSVTDAQAKAKARKAHTDIKRAKKLLLAQTNETGRRKLCCLYLKEPALNREFSVVVVSVADSGYCKVPQGGCIISLGTDFDFSKMPRVGDTLHIAYRTNIHRDVVFFNGLCGSPRIVRNGSALPELETENLKKKKFIEQTMRRTAVGTNKDKTKVFFVVVETGRKGKSMAGASLYDLAFIMKSLGAWDAVNLDGGSSTAMMAFDENHNSLFRISGTRLSVTAAMVKRASHTKLTQ